MIVTSESGAPFFITNNGITVLFNECTDQDIKKEREKRDALDCKRLRCS